MSTAMIDERRPTAGGGNFFAVDRRAWTLVCRLGMNPAVAYLVLARGTDASNRRTAWSANAIRERTGIKGTRATDAISRLLDAGAAQPGPGSHQDRPKYRLPPAHEIPRCEGSPPTFLSAQETRFKEALGLEWVHVPRSASRRTASSWKRWNVPSPRRMAEELVDRHHAERHDDGRRYRDLVYDAEQAAIPDWIWLPNSLVDVSDGEPAPIELLRQANEIRALHLLVLLYAVHNLRDDGGIHFRWARETYEKHVGLPAKGCTVTAFTGGAFSVSDDAPFVQAYLREIAAEDIGAHDPMQGFMRHWHLLESLGLIERVPHLVHADGLEGEIVHPMAFGKSGRQIERDLALAAQDAALAILREKELIQGPEAVNWLAVDADCVMPVAHHLRMAQLIGIVRMRHQPQTAQTRDYCAMDRELVKITRSFIRLAALYGQSRQSWLRSTSRTSQGKSRHPQGSPTYSGRQP